MFEITQSFKAMLGVIGFNALSKKQRQVTFYSEGKNYWPHLEDLLLATLEQTNMSVCYVTSSIDDPGLMLERAKLKTFFIGLGFVRNYFFQNLSTDIMVMTMPDLHKFQIKRSNHNVHYVYVQHSLVSLHMVYRHGAFDHYDTICAAGPHHVQEIRALEAKYNLPPKKIVELGYSRLDSLIKKTQDNSKIKDTAKRTHNKILVAPSWGSEGVIESGIGKILIAQLLALGHEVILRPHPQTLKFTKVKVDEIIKSHIGNNCFSYEDDVTGQDSLHHSDIMISDWSGAALEYALALHKPVIFCNVPRKVNNPNYLEINIEPIEVRIREKIGVIWDGVFPIANAIKLCEKYQANKLQIHNNQYVFNLRSSNEIFAKLLKGL